MKKHTSFPKIAQYKNVLREIQHAVRYTGSDELGNPIYDVDKELPVVKFTGTVKLHGTNAAVCYNKEHGMWAQSRSNIITVKNDNFGFAAFVHKNKEHFANLFQKIDIPENHTACIYGEWVGRGVQRGIAIGELQRSFFIFDLKLKDHVANTSRYIPFDFLESTEERIYNILNYPTFTMNIDLNYPKDYVNRLIAITEEVEKECPVGKAFNISGIGEGVVWKAIIGDSHFRFKVKGEKHSVTKVKKLVTVDQEKLDSIKEFVDYAVTENRVLQGMQEVGANSKAKTGDLMRWMINDILTEEVDTLIANGLIAKDVTSQLAHAARTIFFKKIL